MSYASSIAQIKGDVEKLQGLRNTIEGMDMDSIWEGPAHDKQKVNLESLLSALDVQIGNCNTLAAAMELIDQYDDINRTAESYASTMASLNRNADNYQSVYNKYKSEYNSAILKRNKIKKDVDSTLSGITGKYSESLTDLSPVEVTSTVDIYKDTVDLGNSIATSLDMKKAIASVSYGKLDESKMYPNFENTDAWIGKNPYAGRNTGQCTWFAWGRFYEIYGFDPGFRGNGNQCVGQLVNAHPDKFERSNTPVAGSVFSTGLGQKYGHVGIVLEVDEENDRIVIQDGNYNGSSDSFAVAQKDWGTKEYSLAEFNKKRGGTIYAVPKK